jgi:cytidylate kinase
MSIIAVSAWSHCRGEEIARGTAERLGYAILGPELLEEVAERWHVAPAKLAAAMGRQHTLLGVTPRERQRLLAYVEAATLDRLAGDQVVTWGLNAHLHVMGVSHVLKTRLVRDGEARVLELAEQSGTAPAAAAKALKKEDDARVKAVGELYRQREDDPTLYDLTINTSQIDVEQAVGIIAETVRHKRFKPMTFSRKIMRDLALAARVRAQLVARHPEAQVASENGHVRVTMPAMKRDQPKKVAALRDLAQEVEGMASLRVELVNDYVEQAAQSMR